MAASATNAIKAAVAACEVRRRGGCMAKVSKQRGIKIPVRLQKEETIGTLSQVLCVMRR